MQKIPIKEQKDAQALENLGKRLRAFRKQKGIRTAEEAAYKFNIQRSQYTRYESGKSNINYLTLINILEKMEISLAEFFSEGFE